MEEIRKVLALDILSADQIISFLDETIKIASTQEFPVREKENEALMDALVRARGCANNVLSSLRTKRNETDYNKTSSNI